MTRRLMERLKLELSEEKTRIVDAWAEQFDFLGYTFGAQYSPRTGVRYPGAVPSKTRVRRLQKAVHDYLQPHNQVPVEEVVEYLNRLLDGWARYFSYGSVSRTYRKVDRYVADRLRRCLVRRHKLDSLGTRQFSNIRLHREYGLRQLSPSSAW